MKHSLEQLILYLEDELEPAERKSLEQQLELDTELRQELQQLRASIRLATENQPQMDVDDSYFRSFYERLQPRLKRPGSFFETLKAPFRRIERLGFAGSMALVVSGFVVVAVAINLFFIPRTEVPQVRSESISIKKNERFLDHVAAAHLQRSELLLREISNLTQSADVDELTVIEARERSSQLLEENRSYRNAAVARGDEELAALLADLEMILVELSNLDPEGAEFTIPSVSRAIRKRNLLIKIEIINVDDLEASGSRAQQEVV